MSSRPFKLINADATGAFLLTAEHASHRIPCSYSQSDARFLKTHWAWDIGIAPLIEEVCHALSCRGVQSEFSRLWIDANRAPQQEGLIKEMIEGTPLSFNQKLSKKQRDQRLIDYHIAYHQAITDAIQSHRHHPILVSLHSFTPIWDQTLRSMDIGILFDRDERLAHTLANIFEEEGFYVALNEPYSGKNGLIYAAHRHGVEQQIPYVEIEFNQSILSSSERITEVASRLTRALIRLQKNHWVGGQWQVFGRTVTEK